MKQILSIIYFQTEKTIHNRANANPSKKNFTVCVSVKNHEQRTYPQRCATVIFSLVYISYKQKYKKVQINIAPFESVEK